MSQHINGGVRFMFYKDSWRGVDYKGTQYENFIRGRCLPIGVVNT